MIDELSLSTMSARGHYPDLLDYSRDARSWGYTAVEANAFVTTHEMLDRLAEGPLPISSLHNPTPNVRAASGVSSYDLNLSSLDEAERLEAIGFARHTIELAAQFGAHAVVLHLGHVPIDRQMQRQLHDMWHEGRTKTPEYIGVQRRIPEIRARSAASHLERALETMRELEGLARERGVLLGIETRNHLHEIPNVDELDVLLAAADPAVVGYWHDAGHAATQQRVGSTTHAEWLRRHGHRMIGIHLHDMDDARDHQCPGSGEIDWALLARHVPAEALRVCEIGEWNAPPCLSECPEFLANAGLFAPHGANSANN
jgi:sugar phosphate isomerase/epimerase